MNYDYYVVDTNVLMRYLVQDDKTQVDKVVPYFSSISVKLVIPNHVLCEVVWIMCQKLETPKLVVRKIILSVINQDNVVVDDEAVNTGLEFMRHGGDFADGVIAYQVSQRDNACLLTFDKKAQKVAHTLGIAVVEPS